MGTSSSGGGAGGSNPLIPSWIPPIDTTLPPTGDDANSDNQGEENNNGENETDQPVPDRQQPIAVPEPGTNRYRQPKSDFNKFVRSGGQDKQAFSNAVRGYSRSTGGKTQVLARRMRPSASRVASFFDAVNAIKNNGLTATLKIFNLSSYENKSLLDTLSALSDVIFRDNGELYENTQDDSITKLAYANTITRVCEETALDLNNLTNEQIEVMTAIFIEETIAQRVICDLGNKLPSLESDIEKLLDIENNAYQIINGLVRTQIMPEIIATQRGNDKDLNKKIENIYRIAFDALGGIDNK
jgi:hypothetical protein